MDRFGRFYEELMKLEGYTEQRPMSKHGGVITVWGIDAAAQPPYIAAAIANGKINREAAKAIALVNYYLPIAAIDDLDPRLAFYIFDLRFHGWNKISYRRIQDYVTGLGHKVELDGMHGPEMANVLAHLSGADVRNIMNILEANSAADAKAKSEVMPKRFGDVSKGIINRYQDRIRVANSFAPSGEPVMYAGSPQPMPPVGTGRIRVVVTTGAQTGEDPKSKVASA